MQVVVEGDTERRVTRNTVEDDSYDDGKNRDVSNRKENASSSLAIREQPSSQYMPPEMWVAELQLYSHDHRALCSDTVWLNDNIIYAAQMLLKESSKGSIEGLQSTQCAKLKDMFPPLPLLHAIFKFSMYLEITGLWFPTLKCLEMAYFVIVCVYMTACVVQPSVTIRSNKFAPL